ncbi:hypothetical protein DUNSADRAFT_9492 [Dunaliella salina]|uniref:Uncharacterized protein n=1 Tax=Dunaliella salina TaxID=3046 RepID=A0ABQ7GHC0_DUNSA|nr:hypothetical protein DUNSADRAFT_9492 [Dunaliella salina]|eukprot:KAF5834007.1 hypothetical protein DUNSADRAFT_9492 [Dunaliella salina]
MLANKTCTHGLGEHISLGLVNTSSRLNRRPLKAQQASVQVETGGSETAGASATFHPLSRRNLFATAVGTCLSLAGTGVAAEPVIVQTELTPNQSLYDPKDPDLVDAALMMQDGLNAADVKAEEAVWTRIIDKYKDTDRQWTADIVGRAYGNRGNARTRQGRIEEALADYNEAIRLSPWSPNPVLNRGIAYEALGRYEDAAEQYKAVIAVDETDPAGWNNLGNSVAGMGNWEEAVTYYGKAAQLAPGFSFAAANEALGLYQIGQTTRALKEMRALLRRYPTFTDMRAGLAAALWAEGLEGQAESQWERVDDSRYKDREWLVNVRKWPPRLSSALIAFLDLRSVPKQA